MSENTLLILFIALAITTLALSFYLGVIWNALKKREKEIKLYEQELEKTLLARKESILESLRIICLAVTQDQCEISEGVVRVKNLIDEIDFLKEAPTLQDIHRIYEHFVEFPYLTERESLSKQEKFHQDNKRFLVEEEHEKRFKSLCFELLTLLKMSKQ